MFDVVKLCDERGKLALWNLNNQTFKTKSKKIDENLHYILWFQCAFLSFIFLNTPRICKFELNVIMNNRGGVSAIK